MGEDSLNKKEAGQEGTLISSDTLMAEVVSRPDSSTGQGTYTVQVATFAEKTDAEKYVAELKRQSLSAFQWEIYLPNQGPLHRICIGNFNTLREAQGVARDLQERGLKACAAKLPVEKAS